MRLFVQWITRLYPSAWRRRYEQEFSVLLDETKLRWTDALDVLKGALEMHFRFLSQRTKFALTSLACAVVGAALGFVLSPTEYVATSVIRLEPLQAAPPATEIDGAIIAARYQLVRRMNALAQQVLSRRSLEGLIDQRSLYGAQRSSQPALDVVKLMAQSLRVGLTRQPSPDRASTFEISFAYRDPVHARIVAEELAAAFVRQNAAPHTQGSPLRLILLPSRPIQSRSTERGPAHVAAGAACGLAVGALLSLYLSRKQRGLTATP